MSNKFVSGNALSSATKRRQKRTVFPVEAVKVLTDEFESNRRPNAFHMTELAKQLGLEYKAVRVWFCNKRQSTKNT